MYPPPGPLLGDLVPTFIWIHYHSDGGVGFERGRLGEEGSPRASLSD